MEKEKSELKLTKEEEKAFMEELRFNYLKMHTPWKRLDKKVGRNEICPYCDSGLKYKRCACYNRENNIKYTINDSRSNK